MSQGRRDVKTCWSAGNYAKTRTCTDCIQCEGAGEERICDSLLFQIEYNILPDECQGVDCRDSGPFGERKHS